MVDKPALRRLLGAFAGRRPALEAALRRQLRNSAVAADVMQESWLKLSGGTDATIENADAYVRRVVRNTATDHIRKERRCAAINAEVRDLLWPADDECSPERILMGRQALAAVAAALEQMPERSRIIFAMSRFEGKTHREIAERFGITEQAVFYHIRRVLEHLAVIRDDMLD
jgi:RNA polymerase sigma-70 factor (ECF subfamily)